MDIILKRLKWLFLQFGKMAKFKAGGDFQPHRYTRTFDLFDDFVEVLSTVDYLILLDVYAAGEKSIKGADSRSLAKTSKKGKVDSVMLAEIETLQDVLKDIVESNDLIAFLGAGDIGKVVESFN